MGSKTTGKNLTAFTELVKVINWKILNTINKNGRPVSITISGPKLVELESRLSIYFEASVPTAKYFGFTLGR